MNPTVNKRDLDAIEQDVFPDICDKLLLGFRVHLDKRHARQVEIATFEDETIHTIRGDTMEIVLCNVDGIPLEDICNIASQHPCYLMSYVDKGLIRLCYNWVDPGQSKTKRKQVRGNSGPSFWTFRRLLVLLVLAVFITVFKTRIATLIQGVFPSSK